MRDPLGWQGVVADYFHDSQNTFEVQHGVESERNPYNAKCLQEAWQEKRVVHGHHAGLSDLFVPIVTARNRVEGVLVTGPFSVSRATSAEILERWRWLTGRQGQPGDPEFAHYLAVTLATLVLEGQKLATYRRLLTTLARMMIGEGQSKAIVREVEALSAELEPVRFIDRMWEGAQSMVDDRTTRVWSSRNYAPHLALMGISRAADHVLVGLGHATRSSLDPVDEAVRRDAFQRACAEVARSTGEIVAGKVGDHGVMFLSAFAGSKERKRQRLDQLIDRVSVLGRREYGLSLHFGSSLVSGADRLSASYQQALGAAESALSQGIRLVGVERGSHRALSPLWQLRQELVRGIEERAGAMQPRFDRYAEAVARHSGHRIDSLGLIWTRDSRQWPRCS